MIIMRLDGNINYIVSGLERSGTSMLMQILVEAGVPTFFDDARKADKDNPKGYFELRGGKIINSLMENRFPFNEKKGKFIKITAYGLRFLPRGNYKIIYSERNIDEILDSMEEMMGKKDIEREKTKETFLRLNSSVKDLIGKRDDICVCYVNYNSILSNPEENIKKILDFLNVSCFKLDKMIDVVDRKLYRKRR